MTNHNNPSTTSTPPTPPPSRSAGPTGDPAIIVRPAHQQQLVIFGIPQHLSPREARLLVALSLHPRQVLTYTDCHRAIYGHDTPSPSWPAVVRDLIKSLRNNHAVPIVTIYQQGYMLQMPPDEVSVLPVQPTYPPT